MTRLCALYRVTPAGYYAWRRRPECAHAAQDRQLMTAITGLVRAHQGRYGSPRIHEALCRAGWRGGRRRVERLMRAAGLRARVVRAYRSNPRLHRFFDRYPNQLPRRGARQPDQVWVGDITYVPVGARRWRFLAEVLDQYSRRVLAWALATRRDGQLTRRVLDAALQRRRPRRGLIFHSDRGSEYVATVMRTRLQTMGMQQSSALRGPEDNPHMESFFHSLKAKALDGEQFATTPRLAIARYCKHGTYRSLRAGRMGRGSRPASSNPSSPTSLGYPRFR